MATTARNVRVADDLWRDAKAAAAARGTNVTAYVVGKLRELVDAEHTRRAFVDGLTAPGGRDDDYTAAALDAATEDTER